MTVYDLNNVNLGHNIGDSCTDLLTFLSGSGYRKMSVLQQPVFETVQPGDSVTLNCTIPTQTCVGEHSVYSDMAQENPFQESFTPMETGVISVRRALRLLHRDVSTTSPRGTSASLMLGLTTVLWPHVGRYCLGMGPSWTFKVDDTACILIIFYCSTVWNIHCLAVLKVLYQCLNAHRPKGRRSYLGILPGCRIDFLVNPDHCPCLHHVQDESEKVSAVQR